MARIHRRYVDRIPDEPLLFLGISGAPLLLIRRSGLEEERSVFVLRDRRRVGRREELVRSEGMHPSSSNGRRILVTTHRSLGAVVAGTARWASQHYRSRISHGFQKLPTYIYPRCLCMFMPVCGQSLRGPLLHPTRLSVAKRNGHSQRRSFAAVDAAPWEKGVIICGSSVGHLSSANQFQLSSFLIHRRDDRSSVSALLSGIDR